MNKIARLAMAYAAFSSVVNSQQKDQKESDSLLMTDEYYEASNLGQSEGLLPYDLTSTLEKDKKNYFEGEAADFEIKSPEDFKREDFNLDNLIKNSQKIRDYSGSNRIQYLEQDIKYLEGVRPYTGTNQNYILKELIKSYEAAGNFYKAYSTLDGFTKNFQIYLIYKGQVKENPDDEFYKEAFETYKDDEDFYRTYLEEEYSSTDKNKISLLDKNKIRLLEGQLKEKQFYDKNLVEEFRNKGMGGSDIINNIILEPKSLAQQEYYTMDILIKLYKMHGENEKHNLWERKQAEFAVENKEKLSQVLVDNAAYYLFNHYANIVKSQKDNNPQAAIDALERCLDFLQKEPSYGDTIVRRTFNIEDGIHRPGETIIYNEMAKVYYGKMTKSLFEGDIIQALSDGISAFRNLDKEKVYYDNRAIILPIHITISMLLLYRNREVFRAAAVNQEQEDLRSNLREPIDISDDEMVKIKTYLEKQLLKYIIHHYSTEESFTTEAASKLLTDSVILKEIFREKLINQDSITNIYQKKNLHIDEELRQGLFEINQALWDHMDNSFGVKLHSSNGGIFQLVKALIDTKNFPINFNIQDEVVDIFVDSIVGEASNILKVQGEMALAEEQDETPPNTTIPRPQVEKFAEEELKTQGT